MFVSVVFRLHDEVPKQTPVSIRLDGSRQSQRALDIDVRV